MAQRHAEPIESGVLSVTNDQTSIERAEAAILGALGRQHYPKASVFAIKLSLHEAMSNGFRHGHKGLAAATPIEVEYRIGHQEVELSVRDQGPGFRPEDVPDPTLEENLERGSGRGLLLIRAYMSSAEYLGAGNHLRMVYRRPPGT